MCIGSEYSNCAIAIEQYDKQKLKEYEIPRFFSEIDKIPHKKNGGKQDFLLLESLAKDIASRS